MKKLLLSVLISCLAVASINAQKSAYTLPEANQILEGIHQYLSIALEDSIKARVNFRDNRYLLPLVNYIDYSIIGKGKVAHIYEEGLRTFISSSLESGSSLADVSAGLIKKYEELLLEASEGEAVSDGFSIGGFAALETEYHQELNGEYATLIEVNQLRLYFASRLNSGSKKNNIDVLAEFNPVPEEVIHHIDEAFIKPGDTLRPPPAVGDGPVPFERLFVVVNKLGGSRINLTLGQFRNPFGLWSDFSSHRNFSSTKNNALVNGFALKKIELGIKIDFKISNNLELEAAVVHGRTGRTSPLFRADNDSKKDLVAHLTYSKGNFFLGSSGYLAEFSTDRTAFGIDFGFRTSKLLISGEWVMQSNISSELAPVLLPNTHKLKSHSAYAQMDYSLTNKLHWYGLYDWWTLKADGVEVNQPAFKAFNGLKYYLSPKVRWTIIEYGHMFHKGFDKGFNHLSTQLEVNF
jgi:hypothetical protein